jgi:hypothetical protein
LKSLDIDPVFEMLRYGALLKARHLLGLNKVRLYWSHSNFTNPVEMQVLDECKNLSLEQIIALIMFYCTQRLVGQGFKDRKDMIRVPLDRVEEVFFAYRCGDVVKLKLLLGKIFTPRGVDFPEVTFEFASKGAPRAYECALTKVKDGRVQMEPCELTLLPIQHCRWCGLVRHEVLRLCQECEGDLTFPFRTWFCSDECERQAMDKLHREEHARHLIIAIGGMECVREELKPPVADAPKGVEKKKKKKSGKVKK